MYDEIDKLSHLVPGNPTNYLRVDDKLVEGDRVSMLWLADSEDLMVL